MAEEEEHRPRGPESQPNFLALSLIKILVVTSLTSLSHPHTASVTSYKDTPGQHIFRSFHNSEFLTSFFLLPSVLFAYLSTSTSLTPPLKTLPKCHLLEESLSIFDSLTQFVLHVIMFI